MKNRKSVIQQKPDNILNMVQSDDPYVGIDHERDERFGETQCPSDNPSMCGYDPSKFLFSRLFLLIIQNANLAKLHVKRKYWKKIVPATVITSLRQFVKSILPVRFQKD